MIVEMVVCGNGYCIVQKIKHRPHRDQQDVTVDRPILCFNTNSLNLELQF